MERLGATLLWARIVAESLAGHVNHPAYLQLVLVCNAGTSIATKLSHFIVDLRL